MGLFGDCAARFTKATTEQLVSAQVLILDTIGLLSSSYQYGEFAYIGGGFGVGIHNTLEAATFAIPIAFGPKYQKFKEATDMISLGACCSVSNAEELSAWFTPLLSNEELYNKKCRIAREYTSNQCGATGIIARTILCE